MIRVNLMTRRMKRNFQQTLRRYRRNGKCGKNQRPGNLVGMVFGRLTALEYVRGRGCSYRCQCTCGATCVVQAGALRSGATQSCGCFQKESARQKILGNQYSIRHGMHDSPTYHSWEGMIQRCTNPNAGNFDRYGAVGITVCERWRTFDNFLADMGERPTPQHQLGRILDMGNYEPGNVVWQTPSEQGLCRRNKNALMKFAAVAA
jgi:hypothetical protein